MCCLQETHLSSKDKHRLKVKGWKMISKQSQKKVTVTILISDKTGFKPKKGNKRQRWMFYND